MTNANMTNYTIGESTEVVSVGEFRGRISALEKLVHVDLGACASLTERQRWMRVAQRIGGELIRTSCKRAKVEDWDRREKVIERSTSRIIAVMDETQAAAA